jgi:hypothetical protein
MPSKSKYSEWHELLEQLIQTDAMGTNAVSRRLMERCGISRATSMRWIKLWRSENLRPVETALGMEVEEPYIPLAASDVYPEDPSKIDLDNLDEERWVAMDRMLLRGALFRRDSDVLREKSETTEHEDRHRIALEKIALAYDANAVKLSHWDKNPPDRLMSHKAIRDAAVVAMLTGAKYMSVHEMQNIAELMDGEIQKRVAAESGDAASANDDRIANLLRH